MTGRLFIRISLDPSGAALGPGMSELMQRIEEQGSIRKAAFSMDMGYQKAWLLIDHLQRTFGAPVITTEIGGSSRGGTRLTELGHKLVQSFQNVQNDAERATAADVRMLSGLVRKGIKRRLRKRGLKGSMPVPKAWRQ